VTCALAQVRESTPITSRRRSLHETTRPTNQPTDRATVLMIRVAACAQFSTSTTAAASRTTIEYNQVITVQRESENENVLGAALDNEK